VIRRVSERRLTQVKAAQLLGLGPRQAGRLCASYGRHGPTGLVATAWEGQQPSAAGGVAGTRA
jgi:hypothetical protein